MLFDCPPFKRRAVPAITFLVEDLLHRISALFFQQLFVGALNFSENCLLLLTFFRHSGNALTISSCSWNVSISKEHLQSKQRKANKKLSRLKHTITNIKKKIIQSLQIQACTICNFVDFPFSGAGLSSSLMSSGDSRETILFC